MRKPRTLVKTKYKILRTRKSKMLFVLRRIYAPIGFALATPLAITGCILLIPTICMGTPPPVNYIKVPETILKSAWKISGIAGAVHESFRTMDVLMTIKEFHDYQYDQQVVQEDIDEEYVYGNPGNVHIGNNRDLRTDALLENLLDPTTADRLDYTESTYGDQSVYYSAE